MRWLYGITRVMDMDLGMLWEMVRDRKTWGVAVHGVTMVQTWLGDWKTILPYVLSMPAFWEVFFFFLNHKWMFNFVKTFFCVIQMNIWFSFFTLLMHASHWLTCRYWKILASLGHHLHHSTIVHDPFDGLLDLVC